MNSPPDAVSITILDKEYMVACPQEEREDLLMSARYLDQRMKETRDNGKVLGTERMAVHNLQTKIDAALSRRHVEEGVD